MIELLIKKTLHPSDILNYFLLITSFQPAAGMGSIFYILPSNLYAKREAAKQIREHLLN